MTTAINSGVGIINYCGHGNDTMWGSPSPGYTVSLANALTNGSKTPIAVSVACLVGHYNYTTTLGEAFQRNANGGTVCDPIRGLRPGQGDCP